MVEQITDTQVVNIEHRLNISKYDIITTDEHRMAIVLAKQADGCFYVRYASGSEATINEFNIESVLQEREVEDAIRLLMLREFMYLRDADIAGIVALTIHTDTVNISARELPVKFTAAFDYGTYKFTSDNLAGSVATARRYKQEQELCNPKALPAY